MLTVLSVREAQNCVLRSLKNKTMDVEEIPVKEALGRVAGEELKTPEEVPAFSRATMDGFAVRSADTFGASEEIPALLVLKDEIFMGKKPTMSIGPGEAMAIPTGGMLPPASDSVSMIEYSEVLGRQLAIYRPVAPFENIIQAGEDFKKGDPVVNAGRVIRPQEVAILAALGFLHIKVYKRPRVCIFSTGDELVSPGETPGPAQIRDINGPMLSAQVQKTGGYPRYMGIISDEKEKLKAALLQSLEEADLIIISGGSSVGTRDVTVSVIDELPGEGSLFHGISMRPGKPLIYGMSKGKPIYGLSGNPVSAMFGFMLFVEPVLRYMQGLSPFPPFPPYVEACLDTNLSSPGGREDYVRVRLSRSNAEGSENSLPLATPVFGGPGLLSPVVKGDGYFVIPRDIEGLQKGSKVKVFLI